MTRVSWWYSAVRNIFEQFTNAIVSASCILDLHRKCRSNDRLATDVAKVGVAAR